MKLLTFAAIDIGSNAIRMLISDVIDNDSPPSYKKVSLVRIPIRLGKDVFSKGKISKSRAQSLIESMHGYKHIMQAFHVIDYRACATSAMREAKNGQKILNKIKSETGIEIDIITGQEEAELIFSTEATNELDEKGNYLFVDVGGGSTEITLISGRKFMTSKSFNIGTIRILNEQISKDGWKEMKSWLNMHVEDLRRVDLIGSGGNINKLFKSWGKFDERKMHFSELMGTYHYLKTFTVEERIKQLGLNPHRADVIVPAAKIFLTVMKATKSKIIHIPRIGLADGIIHQLYSNYKQSSK